MVTQLRAIQQQVMNTWVNLGKGDGQLTRSSGCHVSDNLRPAMMPAVEQLETIIAQAVRPGADGPALLKQAQSLVDNQ